MRKSCDFCGSDCLSNIQIAALGFGASVRCGKCSAKLRLKNFPQMMLSFFITLLTIGLLVVMTNAFGTVGFILAFIIPLVVDVGISFFLPRRVVKNGMKPLGSSKFYNV